MKYRFSLIILILVSILFTHVANAQSFGGKKTKTTKIKKPKVPRKEKVVSFNNDNKVVKDKSTNTSNSSKKKGILSKIGDAATRGYGWQLGKEAAKETIKGVKKIANSETVKIIKDKTVDGTKKILKKDEK